jgi:hypothetical protein
MPYLSSLAYFIVLCFSTAILDKATPVKAVNPLVQTRFTADLAPLVWNDTIYIFTDYD